MQKIRARAKDSTLAYYVNQLENLDRRFYEPLISVSWGRDIKLRPGITMSDESTSFILSTFGAVGSLNNAQGNIPWVSPETSAIPGVSVSGKKLVHPLRLAAREIAYSQPELERSQRTGQPIDVQKINAMNQIYQMNIDQMVYVGSDDVDATGLLNDAGVTTSTVATGASGSTLWDDKTPDEMLADVNTLLDETWVASALAVCPSDLLLPPAQFSLISSQKVSSAGNLSILEFLKQNSIALQINGKQLNIKPVKWLTGAGAGSSDRMVAYTNAEEYCRYPMVPVRRETAYYRGISFIAPYLWALGELEIVYPETIQYADGI